MPPSAAYFDADPALPFKYVGGDPAIDLVNTVDWTVDGPVDERLVSYDGLTWWAEGAGVLSAADGAALRRRAAPDAMAAAAAVDAALVLRALLQRLFAAVAAGAALPDDALAALNAALASALARLRVERVAAVAEPTLAFTWQGWASALESPLWPVVWSAARLVASDERHRVRVCGGPRCGWMFVDRSRNGLRRWCQTDGCGARAKARRHYARARAARGT